MPLLAAALSFFSACPLRYLASFIRYWPYDLSLTLNHYRFDYVDGGGWASYFNSIQLALFSAAAGTLLIFVIALFAERFNALQPRLDAEAQPGIDLLQCFFVGHY